MRKNLFRILIAILLVVSAIHYSKASTSANIFSTVEETLTKENLSLELSKTVMLFQAPANGNANGNNGGGGANAVSYTHLTLPTICSV